jgi:hypothetical protein
VFHVPCSGQGCSVCHITVHTVHLRSSCGRSASAVTCPVIAYGYSCVEMGLAVKYRPTLQVLVQLIAVML